MSRCQTEYLNRKGIDSNSPNGEAGPEQLHAHAHNQHKDERHTRPVRLAHSHKATKHELLILSRTQTQVFHLFCLRILLGIYLQDNVTNIDVLVRAYVHSKLAIQTQRRLRWLGQCHTNRGLKPTEPNI